VHLHANTGHQGSAAIAVNTVALQSPEMYRMHFPHGQQCFSSYGLLFSFSFYFVMTF